MRDVIGELVAEERKDRAKETKAAVEEVKRWVEGKLEALEQRVLQHVTQDAQRIEQVTERTNTLWNMPATERQDRQKELKTVFDDAQNRFAIELDAKLAALDERLKSTPSRIPAAKVWRAETVTYQNEFVHHEGATWQARRDTARRPTDCDDWICIARAGRDAVMPKVRGTFDANKNYEMLDIVASDGASFIARRDEPGIPGNGDGWQLMACQGKAGRKGEPGERGPRGEKGEPGSSTASWHLERERYRVSPLESDGRVGPMLELRALFDQLLNEISYLIRRLEDGSSS